MVILSLIAFGFFFLGELNDLYSINKAFQASFFIGCLLLVVSTVGIIWQTEASFPLYVRIPAMIIALFFLFLLILSLFGSFSPKDAYQRQGELRKVYTRKLYALSRHPGVLFLVLLYFCLSVAFSVPILFSATVSFLDLGLALFEDRLVFPKVLSGYKDYQKDTPFLLPTKKSISACIQDFKGNNA